MCRRRENPGRADEYTPIIREVYLKNLSDDRPLKTLAKELAKTHPKLKKLKWVQIWARLQRMKVKLELETIKSRDFKVADTNIIYTTAGQLWADMEARSQRFLQEHLRTDKRSIGVDTKLPVAVVFLADQHIGNEGTDHRHMREDAELIAKTDGLYAILGGDNWDNHIKHLSAIINAKTAPTDQVAMFLWYLSIFWWKILAVVSGNHEYWTKQFAGIDVLKLLMEKNAILYNPHDFKITFKVGEEPYKIYIRHKTRFNSSFNATHTIKQLWRMGDFDFDIGFRGDQHEAAIEPFNGHGQQRWATRGGTYELFSEFAEKVGYPRAKALCPTFILYPDQHRIDGFEDVTKAVDMLKTMREKYAKNLADH